MTSRSRFDEPRFRLSGKLGSLLFRHIDAGAVEAVKDIVLAIGDQEAVLLFEEWRAEVEPLPDNVIPLRRSA